MKPRTTQRALLIPSLKNNVMDNINTWTVKNSKAMVTPTLGKTRLKPNQAQAGPKQVITILNYDQAKCRTSTANQEGQS